MAKLIVDSGSTKTDWWFQSKIYKTPGINPYQQTLEEICDVVNQCQIIAEGFSDAVTEIHFYGAGCTPEKCPIIKASLSMSFTQATEINVYSDMLGAARALCGHDKGIVAILGTGSNSCLYDGKNIVSNVSPLGYILGDEGSGAVIGKHLVADILKHQMSAEVCELFHKESGLTASDIINRVYRTPLPNRFLASLSPFCAKHRELPEIHALLLRCFKSFFERNIKQYEGCRTIGFVGSIACVYEDEIREAANYYGYEIGMILKEPIDRLVEYHA